MHVIVYVQVQIQWGGGDWIASLPLFGRAKRNKKLKCEYGKITANPLQGLVLHLFFNIASISGVIVFNLVPSLQLLNFGGVPHWLGNPVGPLLNHRSILDIVCQIIQLSATHSKWLSENFQQLQLFLIRFEIQSHVNNVPSVALIRQHQQVLARALLSVRSS